MESVYDVMKKYVSSTFDYWKEGEYYGSRNIYKIKSACERLTTEKPNFLNEILNLSIKRVAGNQFPLSFHIMSCGSSGCHFFSDLLRGIGKFRPLMEVYYSERLVKELVRLSSSDCNAGFDAINLIHGTTFDKNAIPVNIGHFRPDVPVGVIKKHYPQTRIYALIRSPIDIALSRSFRKEEYRRIVGSDLSDDEYLLKQLRYVRNFYLRLIDQPFDGYIRYESLKDNPVYVLTDFLLTNRIKFNSSSLRKNCKKNSHKNLIEDNSAATNFNPEPLEFSKLSRERATDALRDVSYMFGY
jgi:hypothetical protein